MPFRARHALKTVRLLATVLIGTVSLSFAADPFELRDRQRNNGPRQPDEVGRPNAGPIGGADIRQHRDRVNAVKAQVFRSGGTPAGATFRAAVNNGESKPNGYVAEARFGDFSQQVKKQVAKELGKSPRADERVAVLVDVQADAVTVATARLAGAVPSTPAQGANIPGVIPSNGARPSDAGAPGAPAGPQNAAPRPAAVRPQTADNSPAAAPPPAGTEARQTMPVARTDAARAVQTPAMPLPMTVRTAAAALVGDRNVALSANTINLEPTAVIPTASGRDLAVRSKDTVAGVTRVELSGRAGDFPPMLRAQIQADLGQTALPARADAPVAVVFEVRADRSVRAVEARSENLPTVSQPRLDSPRAAAPVPNAPNAPAAAAANAEPATDRSPSAPTAVAAPVPSAPSSGRFPALGAAQTLATLSGLNPATVRLQAAREEKSVAVSVPVSGGREIRVEAVRSEERGAPPVIHAEGRLGDFSPQTRAQVTDTLGRFNAAATVTENSTVLLETRPPEGDNVVVTAIAVKPGEPAAAKPVLMWRESDGQQVEAPEAADAAKPVAPTLASVRPVGVPPAAAPAPSQRVPRTSGLAPAAATLAAKAYGIPEAGYELKPADTKGALKIDPVAAGKPSIPFSYRVDSNGLSDFNSTGKPVDFTDAVREQVYEKLRLAVENGESWASEVMKGGRQVKVAFLVNPADADGGQVRVKSVSPTAKDAAVDAAREMGLSDGDFFVVNLGLQGLIVLEQGKTAAVKVGDGLFKIVSPDGNAKIFVRPTRTKKDKSVVLMLSRESMKANRMVLIRAGGPAAAAAVKAAMDSNPDAGEFIVNLDPATDDKIVIRAMMAGAPLNGPSLSDSRQKPAYGE